MRLKITNAEKHDDDGRKFFGIIELESEPVGEFYGYISEDTDCYSQGVDEVYYTIGSLNLTEDNAPEMVMMLDNLLYPLTTGKKLRDVYLAS